MFENLFKRKDKELEGAKDKIRHNHKSYQTLPEKYKSHPEVIDEILILHPENIQYVPEEFKTKERFAGLIKEWPETVKHLPPNLQTDDVYKEFIHMNKDVFLMMPEEHRTKNVCRSAIHKAMNGEEKHYAVFSDVPHSDVCVEAIKRLKEKQDVSYVFDCISKHLQTKEMVHLVVEKDGLCLGKVREDLKSKELEEKAMQENPQSIFYIPREKRTPDQWLMAAKVDPTIDLHVPYVVKTGQNIYSFNSILENTTQQNFSYDEVKAIYDEKRKLIANSNSFGNQENITKHLVWFDRNTYQFQSDLQLNQKEERKVSFGTKL